MRSLYGQGGGIYSLSKSFTINNAISTKQDIYIKSSKTTFYMVFSWSKGFVYSYVLSQERGIYWALFP